MISRNLLRRTVISAIIAAGALLTAQPAAHADVVPGQTFKEPHPVESIPVLGGDQKLLLDFTDDLDKAGKEATDFLMGRAEKNGSVITLFGLVKTDGKWGAQFFERYAREGEAPTVKIVVFAPWAHVST